MGESTRCCENCKAPCAEDLKQVVDLQCSGLVIYVHRKKDEQKKTTSSKCDDTYILHNTGSKKLKRPEYVSELYKFKTKCGQCKKIVQTLRSLLDEIRDIRENEVIGVCEHCKRTSLNKTCKRCDFIVSEFVSIYKRRCEQKKERFKVWLCKVKHLLQAILNGDSVCQHRVYKDTELERILQELKAPLSMREPDIDFFPALDLEQLNSLKSLSESKDMVDELLSKIKLDGSKHFTSDNSLYPSPSKETCICKYLKERYSDGETFGLRKEKSEPVKDVESSERLTTINKDMAETLGDLNKTLLTEDFNNQRVKKLPVDLNKALGQGSSNFNKKLERDLLTASKAQGLTKDENKKVVQGLRKNLNEAQKSFGKHVSKYGEHVKLGEDSSKDRKAPKFKQDKHLDQGKISGSDKSGRSHSKIKSKYSSKQKENLSPENENIEKVPKAGQNKAEKSSLKLQNSSQPSEGILLRMLRSNKDSSERYKLRKQNELAKQKEMELRRQKELAMKTLPPPVKKKEIIVPTIEISESIIVECDIHASKHNLMVRGNKITHYDPRYKDQVDLPVEPLNFKTEISLSEPAICKPSPSTKSPKSEKNMFVDGILRYRLSDRQFIDKGWTKLPTNKVMRKMNIYKMEPANPQYDWFERHKTEKLLFYDSGEKLAEIDDGGRGLWFYRNGTIALDYYNAKDANIGQRYVVYSSGEEMENGRIQQRTVLAVFDVLGNGVVYDLSGQVRLKYNQSEGLIVDAKIGAPGKWKWHNLNEPPVLQQVLINTRMKERDPDIELFQQHGEKSGDGHERFTKPLDAAMLAIELDNFVREKAHKILQKFKPFKIMMKAVKINEHFSLKILDQANICLLFRDGVISLKLNLGRLLISDEIIDTDTSDMADVETPYDKYPPKSDSVENIQKILKSVRSGKNISPKM